MKLYTDGACSPNPGMGGWAAVFLINNKRFEKYGYLENTTNNVMEITAVLEGLKAIKFYTSEVEIISDSQYVINTMSKGWKRNKNIDLWNQLDEEIKNFTKVKWTWVKGHDVDVLNTYCDTLAVNARLNKISN